MHKTLQHATLGAVILALAACGGGGGDEDTGGTPVIGLNGTVDVATVSMPADQSCGAGGFAQALIAEINAARAQARSCGSTAMPAVAAVPYWNTRLSDAALRHSRDPGLSGTDWHLGSDGTRPQDRASDAGYQGAAGEIFYRAWGTKASSNVVIKNAVSWWLNSPGHCEAIMSPYNMEMGAACAKSGTTASLTLLFGTP